MNSIKPHRIFISFSHKFVINDRTFNVGNTSVAVSRNPTHKDLQTIDDIANFLFSFSTKKEADVFLSCSIAVVLFRTGNTDSSQFKENDRVIAKKTFPKCF